MRKWIGRILLAMAVLMLGCMPVCAAEDLKKDMVMETIEEVKLLEKAEGNATVVATLPAGTTVLITEDSSNGWCRVSVKEQSGYLQTTQLKTIGNKDELDAEFEKISNTVQLIFEEIVTMEKETKQARVWGTVIVVLIIAIFGVGIVSALKKNKEEKNS